MNKLLSPAVARAKKKLYDSPKWRSRLFRAIPAAVSATGAAEPNTWKLLDKVYTSSRRKLQHLEDWRFGVDYVRESAKSVWDDQLRLGEKAAGSYCELGCGRFNPYGTAIILYLNGAAHSVCTDIDPVEDSQRAAEATYDLLLDCLAFPDHWHWSSTPRDLFLERIRSFDLSALKAGDLTAGVTGVPVEHRVGDICQLDLAENSMGFISSRAVFEHLMDFDLAMERLYRITAPGGIGHHMVDLVDHRIYQPNAPYDYWSFLADGEPAKGTNRLRAHEIIEAINKAGFEVLNITNELGTIPAGLRDRLAAHFNKMTDEQLEIIRFTCAIRKPA